MSDNSTKNIAIIGYSGHGFVATDVFLWQGVKVVAYCDREEKDYNPFSLEYLGSETDPAVINRLKEYDYFVAIGDNAAREKVYIRLAKELGRPVNAIHPSAVISPTIKWGDGILVAAGAVINPLVQLGNGAICNTCCSIDHECVVGAFAHIGPGAILCGNVTVGDGTFVGAGAVIRQGITIGGNVMIGAGCVVVKDVADSSVMIGNPQRKLR